MKKALIGPYVEKSGRLVEMENDECLDSSSLLANVFSPPERNVLYLSVLLALSGNHLSISKIVSL